MDGRANSANDMKRTGRPAGRSFHSFSERDVTKTMRDSAHTVQWDHGPPTFNVRAPDPMRAERSKWQE